MTGASTLDPDNFPERPDRSLGKGHGTDALGPSDLSDTGSDVMGGPGLASNVDPDQLVHLDRGTNEEEESSAGGTAGLDVGDANFSSDSDSAGTGERASAGRDTVVEDGADIDTDRVESIPDLPLTEDDTDFLASQPPGQSTGRK